MSLLLFIDTALGNALIGLGKDGVLLGSLQNANQQSHASFVQPAIEALLQQHNFSLQEVDGIVVTLGPGSYTGIRVGLATAKGLCFALDKPLLGISTLQAMAKQAILNTKTENENVLFCPMIDARRMEVFTAVFDSRLQEILPTQAIELNENSFETLAINSDFFCIGNGATKFKTIAQHSNFRFLESIDYSPAFIQLGFEYFWQKQFLNLSEAVPLYVKQVFTTVSKK